MKRLWFAFAFLLIAAAACAYEQITVKSNYNEIKAVIDEAISLMTDHSIFQSADVSFGSLSDLAREDKDSINETLIEAKSELEQIYDSSKINFSNIF